MAPTRIIIDTDPGQDDAVAILTALGSPLELEVLGITAVAGNVPLELTTKNALRLVELSGRLEVPVYAGASGPMRGDLVTAEQVHGPTGLDGADLPEPRLTVQSESAVDFLVRTLTEAVESPVTLCTLGPLTNVGMALTAQPAIVGGVAEIVMMGGGCFEGGNVTPAAEFNIYVDPHAAEVVFSSGIPITMMPLDVTHKALVTPQRMDAFRALNSGPGDAVAGMLSFSERYDLEKYGDAGAPLHDPTVIAYLLDPGLFSGRSCHVEIVTEGPALGMTMIDWWRVTDGVPNAMVMNDIDSGGFFALLAERIGNLP